jgi:hypothetical protein
MTGVRLQPAAMAAATTARCPHSNDKGAENQRDQVHD